MDHEASWASAHLHSRGEACAHTNWSGFCSTNLTFSTDVCRPNFSAKAHTARIRLEAAQGPTTSLFQGCTAGTLLKANGRNAVVCCWKMHDVVSESYVCPKLQLKDVRDWGWAFK